MGDRASNHSRLGDVIRLGRAIILKGEIIAFAREFDPQPFHLDDGAARGTLLGGLAASGWHTCTVVFDLVVKVLNQSGLDLKSPGSEEIVWRRPVRPGDELTGSVTLGGSLACPCSGDVDVRKAFVDVRNQNGEAVMAWRMDLVYSTPRHGKVEPHSPCPLAIGRPSRVRRQYIDGIKFFDDVSPGEELALGSYDFTDDNLSTFRTKYETATSRPSTLPHGGTVSPAAGLHVASAWMQCLVRFYRQDALRLQRLGKPVPLLGPAAGIKHLRWHVPVHAGERIYYSTWAERKLEISSHRGWSLLIAGAEGKNAMGQVVVSFYPQILLQRSSSNLHSIAPAASS